MLHQRQALKRRQSLDHPVTMHPHLLLPQRLSRRRRARVADAVKAIRDDTNLVCLLSTVKTILTSVKAKPLTETETSVIPSNLVWRDPFNRREKRADVSKTSVRCCQLLHNDPQYASLASMVSVLDDFGLWAIEGHPLRRFLSIKSHRQLPGYAGFPFITSKRFVLLSKI